MATVRRLIDANALMNWLWDTVDDYAWGERRYTADDIYNMLDDAPTVDAVEVVRCKGCEYYEGDECVNPYIFMSDGAHLYTDPDDYCSYGERREGE